ncbi:MAG TPA: ATP-binding protein [Caulobacteraceae bacterium]
MSPPAPAADLALVAALCLSAGLGCTLLAVVRRQARSTAQLRRMNAELDERRREAERVTAAKSAFLAMVSHELRTPLSGVLAAGEELQGRLEKEQNIEAIDVMVDAGRFMHALLDDLLDLSKLEAGRMTIEKVDFDMGGLVWTLARHWSAAARRTGKPMQLTSALGLPGTVSADPTRIRQVLNNLLSNALKFTGPEGVRWSVEGVDTREGWMLAIRVTDTGPGIPPEKLERLFTPYDQADVSVARTHGGTGLGLALSRELARMMGGDLHVESVVGEGSTFVLTLPVAPPTGEKVVVTQAEPQGVGRAGKLRILVVDDHEINRRTAALLLAPSGAEVVLAATGQEALERLATEPFDVMLTDVNMPSMDGVVLAKTLRASSGPNRAIPIVAVTGGDSSEERMRCRVAGMNGCVPKPIDPRALYRAVEAACAGRDPEAAEAAVA